MQIGEWRSTYKFEIGLDLILDQGWQAAAAAMATVQWFQWGGATMVMGGRPLGLGFGVWCSPVWKCRAGG